MTINKRHHNIDTVIYATGFSLNENWSGLSSSDGTVRSFYGSFYENAPNFFTIYGPHTNLGHFSIIFMIESQMQLLVYLLKIYFQKDATLCQGTILRSRLN